MYEPKRRLVDYLTSLCCWHGCITQINPRLINKSSAMKCNNATRDTPPKRRLGDCRSLSSTFHLTIGPFQWASLSECASMYLAHTGLGGYLEMCSNWPLSSRNVTALIDFTKLRRRPQQTQHQLFSCEQENSQFTQRQVSDYGDRSHLHAHRLNIQFVPR